MSPGSHANSQRTQLVEQRLALLCADLNLPLTEVIRIAQAMEQASGEVDTEHPHNNGAGGRS